jgi:hypothetical protein
MTPQLAVRAFMLYSDGTSYDAAD